MILPGSYQSGFAPRDGRPLYPELWAGCRCAAAPCIGPTGATLRDWSGFGNHGTLTSMDVSTDWTLSGGRYALDFDGSNDYVTFGTPGGLTGSIEMSMSFWCYPTTSATLQIIASKATDTASTQEMWVEYGRSGSATFRVVWGGNLFATSATCAANNPYHVVSIRSGTAGAWTSTLIVNGAVTTATTATNPAGDGPMIIGGRLSSFPFAGFIDDFRAYKRALSIAEGRLLSSRRGIAYELAPRRRSSVQVIIGNRRRRLLIGAH